MRDETKCLHSGYTPKNGEPRVMPIVQSTTYVFDSTEHIGQLLIYRQNICIPGLPTRRWMR